MPAEVYSVFVSNSIGDSRTRKSSLAAQNTVSATDKAE